MKNITLTLVVLLLLGANLTAQETKAIDLMSKALYEENISADYAKASLIYQQVLKDFSQDKKACGQATYRLGLCAEKLGQAKAEEYFIKVVENFSDQQELVNLAKSKLTNSEGIQYFTDPRNRKQYPFVAIGKAYWMAENLAYIPKVSPLIEQGGIWVYEYDGSNVNEAVLTENYNTYGCLYDWETAQKICPEGWHLPSQAEWTDLYNFVGRNDPYGYDDRQNYSDQWIFQKLVNQRKWHYTWIINSTNFNALPGGTRFKRVSRTSFYDLGGGAHFWSSTSATPTEKWFRNFDQLTEKLIVGITVPEDGMSVRCVKNEPVKFEKEIVPRFRFFNYSTGKILRDIESIKFSVFDGEQIERVDFFVIQNEDTTPIGHSFEGQFKRFSIGWDTREFKDGKCELLVLAKSFLGKTYSLSGDYKIKNHDGSKVDGTFTDIRDGHVYNFVDIGTQKWMAQNLNFVYQDGNGSWCQNNLPTNCDIYGRLYDSKSARVVCPAGWHLPTIEEWDTLINYISDSRDKRNPLDTVSVGYKLKSVSGWNYNAKTIPGNGNGDNFYGFNALPGGFGDYDNFGWQGAVTQFWSSSVVSEPLTWVINLGWLTNNITKAYNGSDSEYSYVRCIKDAPPTKN
jgi:uncharacterized protein (TIGR02145 family)